MEFFWLLFLAFLVSLFALQNAQQSGSSSRVPSTHSTDFQDDDPNRREILAILAEFEEDPDKELTSAQSRRNHQPNPIIDVKLNKKGYVDTVYALIEPHHLDKGEKTSANARMALEIRNRGRIENGKTLDQCGHIIAASLGGKMERQNLFPISQRSNLNMYKKSEKDIAQFLRRNLKDKPRVYLRVQLCYDHPDKPTPQRPISFMYSYVMFTDKGSQGGSQSANRRSSETLKDLNSAGFTVEKARLKVCPNRVQNTDNKKRKTN